MSLFRGQRQNLPVEMASLSRRRHSSQTPTGKGSSPIKRPKLDDATVEIGIHSAKKKFAALAPHSPIKTGDVNQLAVILSNPRDLTSRKGPIEPENHTPRCGES